MSTCVTSFIPVTMTEIPVLEPAPSSRFYFFPTVPIPQNDNLLFTLRYLLIYGNVP